MRIVGGSLGGRRFAPPVNIPARPTTDLAREGLFNTLNNLIDLEDCTALELFAGTGSVSYELASRGAAQITVVEQDMASVNFIKKVAADFKITDKLKVVKGDAFKVLQSTAGPFDFIFADPPYALAAMDALPQLILEKVLLTPEGIFVLEHDYRHAYEAHPHFLRAKKYGDTIFTFFSASPNQ